MSVIIVIDDEHRQRDILQTILEGEGYEVHTAPSAEDGIKLIKALNPDVVITDLKMGGMSGMQLMDAIPDDLVKPAVIIMTAYGTISSAVEAMKKGAFDYLTKPLEKDVIVLTIKKATERMELLKENIRLQDALFGKFKIEGIVGESKNMKAVMEVVRKATPTSVTVLIQGESGTGKELIARAVHYNSPRKMCPFTAINCAAIPENLIESELFGYEPGAFTGATHRKIGIFESTDKGTLFLDEIGDLPPLMQTKILRVLQDKEIRRIGGKDSIKVDVRIIAATNKDLEREVVKGSFREDLFFRLNVIPIAVPPLRDHSEDIPLLVEYFMQSLAAEYGRPQKKITPEAMKSLREYTWPGNIRELRNVIERVVIMSPANTVTPRNIVLGEAARSDYFMFNTLREARESFEKDFIIRKLEENNWNISKTAEVLEIERSNLHRKIKYFDIKTP